MALVYGGIGTTSSGARRLRRPAWDVNKRWSALSAGIPAFLSLLDLLHHVHRVCFVEHRIGFGQMQAVESTAGEEKFKFAD